MQHQSIIHGRKTDRLLLTLNKEGTVKRIRIHAIYWERSLKSTIRKQIINLKMGKWSEKMLEQRTYIDSE